MEAGKPQALNELSRILSPDCKSEKVESNVSTIFTGATAPFPLNTPQDEFGPSLDPSVAPNITVVLRIETFE